ARWGRVHSGAQCDDPWTLLDKQKRCHVLAVNLCQTPIVLCYPQGLARARPLVQAMVAPVLLLAWLLPAAEAIPQSTGCSGNCFKALQHPTRAAEASSLCSSILETILAPTATSDLPTWASQGCHGPLGPVLKLSKACSRYLTTSSSPSLSPSSTSWASESTAISTCPVHSTETITETVTGSASVFPSSCPAPSIETTTETITGSASALPSSCPAASTITLPEVTITASASVVITTSTTTTTTTTTSTTTLFTPVSSTCAQLLSNPSFQNPSRALFPWIGTQNPGGPSSGAALIEDPTTSTISLVVRAVRGTTSETENPFVRMTQGISLCAGTYAVRSRAQNRESITTSPGGWVLRGNLRTGGSTYTTEVQIGAETAGVWVVREGVTRWNLGVGTGEFWVDIVPVAPWDGDATVWVDWIELVRV
ncbi:hypothetical protein B0T14DRAFT_84090, partial [Immersiella caudata]